MRLFLAIAQLAETLATPGRFADAKSSADFAADKGRAIIYGETRIDRGNIMKSLYFLPLLALSAPALAADEPNQQTIIVTGTSLSQTERNLRDCIARHCPPDQDVAATLAHAENQFVAGDYEGARRTTKASIGRNNRFDDQYPVPVSNLYRAESRIAAHLGEARDFEQSTWGIKRALKAGLPREDVRLVGADLEVAGMFASLGRTESARIKYEEAAKDAARINRPDLAAIARLRLAWLSQLEGDTQLARRKLEEIASDRSPQARAARLSALVLIARLDRQAGKQDSSDALIQELRGAGFAQPVLLFAPEIKMTQRTVAEEGEMGSTTRLMATQNFDDRWIDVGFWVTPEGHVTDLDVLRSKGPTYWAKPLLASIAGRIYSPSNNGNVDGTYRVERYTFTSLWEERTGTHLRQRSANARIEYLDLTAQPEPRAN